MQLKSTVHWETMLQDTSRLSYLKIVTSHPTVYFKKGIGLLKLANNTGKK